MNRCPGAAVLFAGAVLLVHAALCYPGATQRGWPPIHPFWDGMALCLGLSAVMFFPFFDDRLATRRLIRIGFLALYCFVAGIAMANFRSGVRPSIGHLAGIAGVLEFELPSCIIYSVGLFILFYLPIWGLELLAVDFWRRLRKFPDTASMISPLLDTRIPLLLPVWVLIVLVSCVWAFHDERQAIRQDSWEHNRVKKHHIESALLEYRGEHGGLPQSERGGEYALYALHNLLDASCFALEADDGSTPLAFWDHEEQCLRGGEVLYLNKADVPERRRVILVFRPKLGKHEIPFVRADCFSDWVESNGTTPELLLGSLRKD
jgi:hypothetical protein